MKVFNLACSRGHMFEGWFSDAQDFKSQRDRGLLTCPVCGDADVTKRPSAPYVVSSGEKGGERSEAAREEIRRLTESLMREARDASRRAQDVGDDFVPVVRAMHEGAVPHRLVKGRCSLRESEKLLEDGILVLPVPESADKTLQ